MAKKSSYSQYSFDEEHLRLLQQTYREGFLESLVMSVGAKLGLGKRMRSGLVDDIVSAVDERMPYLLHKFQFRSKWRSYLHKCVHRIMINELYRSREPKTLGGSAERQQLVFEGVLDSHHSLTPQEEASAEEHEQDRKNLAHAMMMLSHEHRHVFTSVDLKGHKYEEVAQRLKIPVGTVRSRLSRARTLLQQNLRQLHAIK